MKATSFMFHEILPHHIRPLITAAPRSPWVRESRIIDCRRIMLGPNTVSAYGRPGVGPPSSGFSLTQVNLGRHLYSQGATRLLQLDKPQLCHLICETRSPLAGLHLVNFSIRVVVSSQAVKDVIQHK